MTPSELNEMRAALMELSENFEPLLEQASGFKRRLEAEGWSTQVAEAAAGEMLIGMLRHVFATLLVQVNK